MVVYNNIIHTTWKLCRQSHSYYVRKYFALAGQIFFGVCVVAFFVNLGLNIFASINKLFELQFLSIINMLLLSFVIFRDPKPKSK